ncbi:MAG: undecaprenyl/decaprenyl-phosphate alpha-N-acetylglucosaminyl 1-phosphate transferase [Chthoniobacter sp.]|nr:undecaprenyl/decaprenyl-phosphate alpha-N-acetylglucosaminyl 1-phosphate transferase [Chthoniobacter sp.]
MNHFALLYALLFFGFGLLVALVGTPWAIRLGQHGIGLDFAHETRKKQDVPVPRLGGLPIMLAAALSVGVIVAVFPAQGAKWPPILVGSLLMYGLGLWDDLKRLGARRKLLGQLLTACIVFSMGLGIEKFTWPGAGSVELGAWSLPVTVVWLIVVPNIVNLIDGFDGLAGGLGLCLATTLGIVALHNEQTAVACYAFTMTGALLGFLIFNFPPAKIYLGDGGAYLIGFTIASLSLTSSNKGSVAKVLVVTFIALGVPILDTTFAVLRRGLRGYPLFHADDEHFHHRLERFGFSKRRILLGIYGVCLVLSLAGLSIIWTSGSTLPIGIGVLCVLSLFALRYFHLLKSWDDVRRKIDRLLGRRRVVAYALAQAQVLELEVERCGNGCEFWEVFHRTIRRVGFVEAGEVPDEIAIQVRYNGSAPWTLYGSRARGTVVEWQRIAECFRPVYAKAQEKWPA